MPVVIQQPICPKNILIVDGNEDTVETLSILYGIHGHRVVGATDGDKAIQAAIKEKPDLILLEIVLPRIDGLTVARTIRKQATESVIAIHTGYANSQSVHAARECKVDYLIPKPAEVDMLEALPYFTRQKNMVILNRELKRLIELDDSGLE